METNKIPNNCQDLLGSRSFTLLLTIRPSRNVKIWKGGPSACTVLVVANPAPRTPDPTAVTAIPRNLPLA